MKLFFLLLLAAGPFVVRAQLRFDTSRLQPGSSLSVLLRPWTDSLLVPFQPSTGSSLVPFQPWSGSAPVPLRSESAASVELLLPEPMPCLTVRGPVEPMPVDRRGNADRMVYRKRTWLLADTSVKR